uniref:Synaptonemal complex central element protein 2 n=1 Tax=Gadus morhua TaxID=8049 RepID=A0A8C5A5S8_GADMO
MEILDEGPSTSHSRPPPPHPGHDDMQVVYLHPPLASSTPHSPPPHTSIALLYQSSTNRCSKIDDISAKVQYMVARINDRRANDQKVMESFQETLAEKVTEFSQEMKEHMYAVYEDNSCDMQTKLEELSGVLERCSQLNEDLLGARQALKGLSQGLALSLTPEQ